MAHPTHCIPIPARSIRRGRFRAKAAVVLLLLALAFIVRLSNLGSFSLWLDEVFQVRMSHHSLTGVWHQATLDPVHPPLSAFVMSLGYELGLTDTGQRLIPIALGVLSILLLAAWVRPRFGYIVALFTASLAVVSPFAVRYSQELRPYPFVLFFFLLALVAFDRLMRNPEPVWGGVLAVALAGGLYSHTFFPVVAVPMLASIPGIGSCSRLPNKRGFVLYSSLAIISSLALFAFWVPHLISLATPSSQSTAQTWTWHEVGRRWEFLTVGGWEGTDLSWGGLLVGLLAAVGFARALRRWRNGGAPVVLGAFFGIVGIELVLHFVMHRWSAARYTILGWPFLLVLIALGAEPLFRRRLLPVGLALGGVVLSANLVGLCTYYARGRDHWDRLAGVIEQVRQPGEPVLTANIFCQLPLEYYLGHQRTTSDAGRPTVPVLPLDRDLGRMERLWPQSRSALLVRGGTPHSPQIRQIASYFPQIASYSSSEWLYRLIPQSRVTVDPGWDLIVRTRRPDGSWPPPSVVLLPERLRDPRLCSSPRNAPSIKPGGSVALDFDAATTESALHSGWSGFEARPDGTTFVWATGTESGIVFGATESLPIAVRATLWPANLGGRTQVLRALVNGRQIGVAKLAAGEQTLQAQVPARVVTAGLNLLVLQFAYAMPPSATGSGSNDHRPLACAFDRLVLQSTAKQ